jgi:aminobenzoyl-glutamate utilization protein B
LVNAGKVPPRTSSSDLGDVCLVTPTGQITVPVWVPGTPAHSWTAMAAGATTIAYNGISAAAKAIALTVCDLMTDEELVKQVQTEFQHLT